MSSGSLSPCFPSFVSRTAVLYWHGSNPDFSAPDTIKFCNDRGKKREEKNELVYDNFYSTSCIFSALLMLFGKNYSGLGQITSTVVGSPYKEKNNWKEVKSCGSAVEPIWQKAFIRVRKGLFKINISRGVGSFAYELQDEGKNQSTVLPKSLPKLTRHNSWHILTSCMNWTVLWLLSNIMVPPHEALPVTQTHQASALGTQSQCRREEYDI